jgi:proline iminopeptidase
MRSLRLVAALLLPLAGSACSDGHAAPRPVREGTVAVAPGITLPYRLFGQGRDTVVLVAGGPGMPSGYFESAMMPLAATHVLVSYDLRGRGVPGGDTLAHGLGHDVDDLERLREALHLDSLRLVGDNWGAVVAAAYAARHPAHVARVAMLSPFWTRIAWSYQLANFSGDVNRMQAYLSAQGAGRDTSDPRTFCREFWPYRFAPLIEDEPSVRAQLAGPMCADGAAALRRESRLATAIMNSVGKGDLRDSVRGIAAPVLLLAGYRQPVYAQMYGEWREALPTARVDSIAAPAMFPWARDPARTMADLRTFLGGAWPAEAR